MALIKIKVEQKHPIILKLKYTDYFLSLDRIDAIYLKERLDKAIKSLRAETNKS